MNEKRGLQQKGHFSHPGQRGWCLSTTRALSVHVPAYTYLLSSGQQRTIFFWVHGNQDSKKFFIQHVNVNCVFCAFIQFTRTSAHAVVQTGPRVESQRQSLALEHIPEDLTRRCCSSGWLDLPLLPRVLLATHLQWEVAKRDTSSQ